MDKLESQPMSIIIDHRLATLVFKQHHSIRFQENYIDVCPDYMPSNQMNANAVVWLADGQA